MASDQVKERIEVAKAESARLERRLRELSDDDLRRPSACDHWEVADVVAHLAFAAQFQARMITRGLEGDDSIPEGARRQESEGTPASERIARGALALRERLGDGLLDTFHQRYQELGQLFDAIGPDDYDKPCWHPWGDTNVSDFVDLAINELAIHGWDVCSSLDPGYHIEQATLPAALAVSSNVLARVVQTGSARFRFELTDAGGVPDLVVGGENAAPLTPSATLHCDGETFLLIVYGRLNMEAALSSGRLNVSGDTTLAKELGRHLTGI